MHHHLALLTLALLGLAAAPGVQAGNLVVNGSFESGFDGWTRGGGNLRNPASVITYNSSATYPTGAYGEPVRPSDAPTDSPDAAGARAAYFVDDLAVNERLSQIVFLEAGSYQIGFSAYLPRNGFNNRGDATFSGSIAGMMLANFAASTAPAQSWQAFSGTTMVATPGNYAIEFVFNTNLAPSKDVVIDQVYIIPISTAAAVAEPASLALFAAGLLGLGVASRRRRRPSEA
ncbi:hypothetical protein DFH01_13865 [Falsiroseomonas bella]|uniref:Uncharacterized protein n=1 Tax=Falsiroseomonas bella TaxID=2184016 RepID=A0A317FB20_9PROT|nr:PEP-CTERM sorting domain-containing protein [Falsiroseomonas bella]PWS36264.1 hypothetical protein DFH01_13865 [Falsiroseomonas bella]